MKIEEYAQLYAVIRVIFGISIFFGLLGWLITFIAQFEMKYSKYKIGLILIFNAIFWGFTTLGVYTKLFNSIRNEILIIVKDPNTIIYQRDFTFGKQSSNDLKNEIKKINGNNSGHSGYGMETVCI